MIAYGIYWPSIQDASEMLRVRIVGNHWPGWWVKAA